MKSMTWPRRWKRSTKASKEQRASGRLPRGRTLPLCLEALEDRTLLSFNPSIVGSAFLPVLKNVQSNLKSSLSAPVSIPLIGSELSAFVAGEGLASLDPVAGGVLSDLLEQALLGQISTSSPVDQRIELDLHAGVTRSFKFDLGLGGKLLYLDTAGAVLVKLDFDYVVDFTYNSNDSVTISATTLTVGLDVRLLGFTATGS